MRRAVTWLYDGLGWGSDRKRFRPPPLANILEERSAAGAVILMTVIIKVDGPVSRGRCEDWSRLRAVGGELRLHAVEGSRVEGVEAGGCQQKTSSGPRGCEGG